MFVDETNMMEHVKVSDAEEYEESEEKSLYQEECSGPYCQKTSSNTGQVWKDMEKH